MAKIDRTILWETKYMAFVVITLSVLMNAVFLILRKWSYTVLLGSVLSSAVAIINFLIMGITIEKALTKESQDAKKLMKASQSARNFAMFVVIGIGVLLPYFNTISVIVPVFFPRIAVMLRPLFNKENEEVIKE